MSENAQISVGWNLYHDNIQSGFSQFQQNGDFVDMTLAADGHLVRVHRLVVGVASPYLKRLIESAASGPCERPCVFLNGVSYSTLRALLEYVYTGEVAVAEAELDSFLAAAKSLQIRGLDDELTDSHVPQEDISQTETKICEIEPSPSIQDIMNPIQDEVPRLQESEGTSNQFKDFTITTEHRLSDKLQLAPMSEITVDTYTNSQELQYTVSSRGSLQLILNRYMYNLFSKSNRGQIRRWRCIDYRDRKCPACCVTNGNVVERRTNMHIHPFHDKKILAKVQKKAIYSAIKSTKLSTNMELE